MRTHLRHSVEVPLRMMELGIGTWWMGGRRRARHETWTGRKCCGKGDRLSSAGHAALGAIRSQRRGTNTSNTAALISYHSLNSKQPCRPYSMQTRLTRLSNHTSHIRLHRHLKRPTFSSTLKAQAAQGAATMTDMHRAQVGGRAWRATWLQPVAPATAQVARLVA